MRNKMIESMNTLNYKSEMVMASGTNSKNVVDEYNNIQETLYLTSTKANSRRLEEALTEMNKGTSIKRKLIEK